MELTSLQAMWFLPIALPTALYVAWSDLKFMRISNRTVLLLAALFLVVGAIALPFDIYLWRLAQMLIVLAIGFVLNAGGLVGGGDAKFAAAMAPFVVPADAFQVLTLFGLMLLGAYATHRLFKMVTPLRATVPDWKSWDTGKQFPMGLALSGTLIFYLGAGLFFG